MGINELLVQQNMSKYRLAKLSGLPQTTVIDICNGKTNLLKCTAAWDKLDRGEKCSLHRHFGVRNAQN